MTIDWPTQILIIEIIVFGCMTFGMGLFIGIKLGQTKQTTVPNTGQLKERKIIEQPLAKQKGFRPKTEEENKSVKKSYTIN